jgi:exosome complex component RRP42
MEMLTLRLCVVFVFPRFSELQRVLTDSGALPLRSLVIIPDAQVWLVNIDVLVMDNGGNLLDAIVMAVKAALLTTTSVPHIDLPCVCL